MLAGIYISVPFCRTKCSYCNFASGVFSPAKYAAYVDRLCCDIGRAPEIAAGYGAQFLSDADSIYWGGGTPSVLQPAQLVRIFRALRSRFAVSSNAEITVECAPGTLSPEHIAALAGCGVNRVSLGVQSFVDEEARAVGRLHTNEIAARDVAHLRAAGIYNINVDLIAGLPFQTPESWRRSLDQLIASGVPHASVYMLEVDEDSRLGSELLAGGARYHAHHVPDEALTVELYESACERLAAAGIEQYEISNFARPGAESQHNLKYWTRQPYFGFGVDAHSMLPGSHGVASLRFSAPEDLEAFHAAEPQLEPAELIAGERALEEEFILGLRLNRGIDLESLALRYGREPVAMMIGRAAEAIEFGLLHRQRNCLALTARGRLLSNEVFQKFVSVEALSTCRS
ncbi:MAG: radical SAM family heme chaperone HemW [Acidobacteria bacterium]|nr:radical SAM family heme chaperone HemW [Acidobacteriota bacterium]